MTNINVSIIIVNYNTYNLTFNCISSIREFHCNYRYEIIVVDNNSNFDCIRKLEKIEDIKLIKNKENLGFGIANNIGFSYAEGEFIWLLNSDTVILNDCLGFFLKEMNTSNNYIYGSILLDPNMDGAHSYAKFPSLLHDLFFQFELPFRKLFNIRDKIEGSSYPENSNGIVDYITGASLFFHRNILWENRIFDPIFFMYYEETDLQIEMKKRNILSKVISGPQIIHLEGASSYGKKISLNKSLIQLKSKFYFFKKHNSLVIFKIYKIIYLLIRVPFLLFSKYSFKDRREYLQIILKS